MPSHESYHKFFQAIVDSIPKLLAHISAENDEEKYKQVSKILRGTSGHYRKLRWEEATNQCAYVFKFFVKHSHLVYESMYRQSHHFDSAWKHLKEIKLCSIGGGPGSDVAGVVEFLEGTSFGGSLYCNVLDLFPEWANAWKAISPNLASRLNPINVGYHRFNMVDETSCSAANRRRVSSADLVTFIKSFSTVCSVESNVKQLYLKVLPYIMNCIKPGGFVLFIDNSCNAQFNAIFKEIALQCGLRVLLEDVAKSTFPGRIPTNIEPYCKKFHYRPMLRCKVTVYLLQKPLSEPNFIKLTRQSWQDIQTQNEEFDTPSTSYSARNYFIPGSISLEKRKDETPISSSVESLESTVQSKHLFDYIKRLLVSNL